MTLSLDLILAGFLIISLFENTSLTPEKIETSLTSKQIVQQMGRTCKKMLNLPQAQKYSSLIGNMLHEFETQGTLPINLFGLSPKKAVQIYTKLCKGTVDPSVAQDIDLPKVIAAYKKMHQNLPQPELLKHLKLPQSTYFYDADNFLFHELYRNNHRRRNLHLKDLPSYVHQAFTSIEDKRFWKHDGVDLVGILRAGKTMATGGKAGGSTITQQMIKNTLLTSKHSFERKFKEVILAKQIDLGRMFHKSKTKNKTRILELYLNYINFGGSARGLETASQLYFNKSAKKLTLGEAAMLAGTVNRPNYYNPIANYKAAINRRNLVLKEMLRDHLISEKSYQTALQEKNTAVTKDSHQQNLARHFVNASKKAAVQLLIESSFAPSNLNSRNLQTFGYKIKTTLNTKLQKLTESALQEGLFQYELCQEKSISQKPLDNISQQVVQLIQTRRQKRKKEEEHRKALEELQSLDDLFSPAPTSQAASPKKNIKTPSTETAQNNTPAWVEVLNSFQPRVSRSFPIKKDKFVTKNVIVKDVHWPLAIILKSDSKTPKNHFRIGFKDGQQGFLSRDVLCKKKKAFSLSSSKFSYGTVLWVQKKKHDRYEFRQLPKVQGAITVMNPHNGKILAMTGSSSYDYSNLNRAVRARRQPGSTVKPFTYMTAFNEKSLQPNTLISDTLQAHDFPPFQRGGKYWRPANYKYIKSGIKTLRYGLIHSKNRMTAQLMKAIAPDAPPYGLDKIRRTMQDFGLSTRRFYPTILGADVVTPLQLVTAYARIANVGLKVEPQYIESILSSDDELLYQNPNTRPQRIQSVDDVSIFQVKHLLRGVLQTGTAQEIDYLSPYAAGKTGTSNKSRSVWFIGFTNDLVIGVYVGHDNGRNRQKKKFIKGTGGSVALPIFENLLNSSFKIYKKRRPFSDWYPGIDFRYINYKTGQFADGNIGGSNSIVHEALRNNYLNQQYVIVPQHIAAPKEEILPWENNYSDDYRSDYESDPTDDRDPYRNSNDNFFDNFFGNFY